MVFGEAISQPSWKFHWDLRRSPWLLRPRTLDSWVGAPVGPLSLPLKTCFHYENWWDPGSVWTPDLFDIAEFISNKCILSPRMRDRFKNPFIIWLNMNIIICGKKNCLSMNTSTPLVAMYPPQLLLWGRGGSLKGRMGTGSRNPSSRQL